MAFSPISFLLASVQAEREGVSDLQARSRLALLGGLLGGSPVTSLTLTTVLARNERDSESAPATSRLVQVPRLENKTPEEAEKILRSLGLKVSQRGVPNKRVPKGLITSQDPDGGVMVPEGAEVKFYVSRGSNGREVATGEQAADQSAPNDPPEAGARQEESAAKS